MNSFYGGKQGAPFIIVNSYKTVAEMAEVFSQGVQNTSVQFDEYVLINTINKNDPDNGRVYRRGYDINATELDPKKTTPEKEIYRSTGGGIYVGTIVGPGGPAPQFNLTTMDEVIKKQEGWEEQTWVNLRTGEGSYAPTKNLIPGYTGNFPQNTDHKFNANDFNDEIQWNFISIRDEYNKDTDVFVGFKFPYPVFSFTAHSEDSYYHRSDADEREENQTADFTNNNLIDRQVLISSTHPFYEYWDLKIPKGIKGDTFKNFRIVSTNTNDDVQDYEGQENDRNGQSNNGRDKGPRQVLVYDYYHYDRVPGGDPVSLYLGDYNMIKSVYFDDDGTFEINYTHNDANKWSKKVNWINSVTLNSITGDFKIIYNNNSIKGTNVTGTNLTTNNGVTEYNVRLKWVDRVSVNDNGSITLRYTTEDTSIVDESNKSYTDADGKTVSGKGGPIKWITNIELDEGGTFRIRYNNVTEPTIFQKVFKTITGFNVDDYGTIKVTYNNIENDKHGQFEPSVFNQKIQWINNVDLANNGTFTITYNTLSANKTPNKEQFNKKIKWIDDIRINNEENSNQKLSILFNNNFDNSGRQIWSDIGSPINYIKEVAVRENDAMLLVYYSDPEMRKNGVTYNNKTGWKELQSVRDYSGFKLGKILNYQVNSREEAIDLLNSNYPNGFNDVDATKVAIVNIGIESCFFGYDYNVKPQVWKYIGSLYTSMPSNMIANEKDANIETLKDQLAVGGVWFVEEVL